METAIVGATYIDSHNWHYLRLAVYEAFKALKRQPLLNFKALKRQPSLNLHGFKKTAIVKF